MAAMTMEFPVKDPAEFARLRTGQRIKATVHQNDADLSYWIAGITELPPPANPSFPALPPVARTAESVPSIRLLGTMP